MMGKRNKYNARPTATVRVGGKLRVLAAAGTNGYRFASGVEEKRYRELKMLVAAKKIIDLEVHPRFPLVVNGHKIGHFTPDFEYQVVTTGEIVVEDVKSKPTMTEAYRLRKNLMKALYQIEVQEIFAGPCKN